MRETSFFLYISTIMDQPKIERLLKLMVLMSGPVDYTVKDLEKKLGMSERTVFRYIQTFRDAGFSVSRRTNVPKLIATNRKGLEVDQLVCFSKEEAQLVNDLVERLDTTNTLKAGLLRKIEAVCDSIPPAEYVYNKSNAEKIGSLMAAIREKKCVVLHDYESGSSLTVSDRMVEPFEFTTNYINIWSYEPSSGKNKTFAVSRIGSVEVLDDGWHSEFRHESRPVDIFRMSGVDKEHVRLAMTDLAKNLLIEEYPLAERFVSEGEGNMRWVLDTDVYSPFGIGRFVMGLAGHVEILEGDNLRSYVRKTVEAFLKDI